MSKEEFIEKIKELKINVPDEMFFLEYNNTVYTILEENEQLKQENKRLKQAEFYGSITFTECPKCGEKYFINYCREVYDLKTKNKKLKEDIGFCLRSIKEEMKVSIDSRTRKEMKTCYEILKDHV